MTIAPAVTSPLALLYAAVLLVAAWTDLRSRRIPNVLTLPAIATALALAYVQGNLALAVTGAVVGALAFMLPMFLYGAALAGGGDVKLAAFSGAVLGQRIIAALFVAGLVATAVVLLGMAARRLSRRSRIPFGPFIAIGGLAALLLG